MANQKHRGVKLLALADSRWVARWRDPITRRSVQKDLAPLGLTNADTRRLWAIEKAKELRTVKAQVAHGNVSVHRETVEKAQADYVATFSNTNSIRNKAPALASIAEHLTRMGIFDAQDITGPALAAWGDHVRRPASEHMVGTRNWHLMAVAAWLRWCRRRGTLPRVTDDQIKDALRRQKAPQDPIAVLTPAAIRAVLASCLAHDAAGNPAIAALAVLTLGTGMRFTEARQLSWSEVDLDEQVIRLGSDRTKTATARTITLAECPVVIDLLKALRLRGSRGRVFPHLTRELAERARKRSVTMFSAPAWTWHMMRRTCGALSVCAGVNGTASAFLVAKRLGHSVTVSERHYLAALTGLPKDASSIEQAGGFEAEARKIVRAIAGVPSVAPVAQLG